MSHEQKKQATIVTASAVISLLLGMNVFFIQRLVSSLDDTAKEVKQLRVEVEVLKGSVQYLWVALDDLKKAKGG